MELERGRRARLVRGVRIIVVGSERNFGVDNQVASAGQQNNDVGRGDFGFAPSSLSSPVKFC